MNRQFTVGEWLVRPQHGSIERGEEVARLKPKTMAVLECLAQAGNEVVTRDQLFETVWPGGIVSDATLSQCIVELRRAFGDSAQEPTVIKTVPKVGFCLLPPVATDTVEDAVAQGGPVHRRSPGLPRGWRALLTVMVVTGMVVGAVAVGTWWQERAVPRGAAAGEHPNGESPSIAVLPFVNLSEEPGNEYFADGLSEELRNLLAKTPQVRVAATTSSFAFRDSDLTIREIAEALNVEHVLEGSVRKAGDRLRITVHLIQASSGFDLWAESFDRTLDDIFTVQNEIAAAVVDGLPVGVVGVRQTQPETSTEAYGLYLQAGYFFSRVTRDGRTRAVQKLQETLAIDPEYAPALQLLAAIYTYQANAGELPFDEGFELGREFANKALQTDPGLRRAMGTLSYIQSYYDWDWDKAGETVRQMMRGTPGDPAVYWSASNYYGMTGSFEHAVEVRAEAIRLDPVSAFWRQGQIFNLITLGRLDQAEQEIRTVLDLYPNLRYALRLQAKIHLLRGDFAQALDWLDRQVPAGEPETISSTRAIALHALRGPRAANALFEAAGTGEAGEVAYERALYLAWAGQHESALDFLEQAFEQRYRVMAYMLGEPLLFSLRGTPRWRELLRRMGLLEHWLSVPAAYGGPEEVPETDIGAQSAGGDTARARFGTAAAEARRLGPQPPGTSSRPSA